MLPSFKSQRANRENTDVFAAVALQQQTKRFNKHYFVRKKVTGNKTTTAVSLLNTEERVLEIAKMLSGNPPSDVAKENARELLGC